MPKVPEIDSTTAISRFNDNDLVVDIREQHERDAFYVPGSIHFPMQGSLEAIAREWPDRSTPLLILCHSGVRSAHVVKHLQKAGYENSVNIKGGIIGWARAGGAVAEGS